MRIRKILKEFFFTPSRGFVFVKKLRVNDYPHRLHTIADVRKNIHNFMKQELITLRQAQGEFLSHTGIEIWTLVGVDTSTSFVN